MEMRFILVCPTSGRVVGNVLTDSPVSAAQAVDAERGGIPGDYTEEQTSTDLEGTYLVYCTTESSLGPATGDYLDAADFAVGELRFVSVLRPRGQMAW